MTISGFQERSQKRNLLLVAFHLYSKYEIKEGQRKTANISEGSDGNEDAPKGNED